MSDQKKYYVYVHRYASGPKKGQVFYVGKGQGNRAWHNYSRNAHWKYTVKKYDFTVDVKIKFFREECAHSFECALIKKYGVNNLVNMTDGGEGCSGQVSDKRKVVHCSNGMTFPSLKHATEWVSEKRGIGARQANISACANGKAGSSYGFNWSFVGVPDEPTCYKERISKSLSSPVFCGNGMKFNSVNDAMDWLVTQGLVNPSRSCILEVCKGKYLTYKGLTWSRTDIGIRKERGKGERSGERHRKPVVRSDGVEFESVSDAAKFMVSSGLEGASISHISSACRIPNRSAYGYKWSYL